MNKADRQNKIKELQKLGTPNDEIVNYISTNYDVSERTVKSDIKHLTEPTFMPKKCDMGFVHVKLEATQYDSRTGKKLSKPNIVLLTKSGWASAKKQYENLGYDVIEVLYMPE